MHDFTRQLVTQAPTKHDCKDSVDNFLSLIRERLSSDPAFKELLFSTKPALSGYPGFIDSTYTDPHIAAFMNKLHSKKLASTTTKITESDLLNSTLLVDLVEAVIFRSSGGNGMFCSYYVKIYYESPYFYDNYYPFLPAAKH